MKAKSEIFTGNIGTVRNELTDFLENNVESIVSLTQSVSTTGGNTTPILTIVLVYVPLSGENLPVREPKAKEQYL